MKIVVIGGSGLIGSKLVTKLREQGHEAIAASPKSGVNTLTGEGLAETLKGASASPSPVRVLTPDLGDAAIASCACSRNLVTSFDPIRPLPPITTIFMIATSIFGVPPCVSSVKRKNTVPESPGSRVIKCFQVFSR